MAKKKKLAGFRDARQKRYRGARRQRKAKTEKVPVASTLEGEAAQPCSEVVRLRLGPGGRFVIPKKLRKAMKVKVGDAMTAEVVDNELRVLGLDAAIRKIQAMFAPYKRPGVSEVDELIKERKREFEMEERDIEEDRRRAAMNRRNG